MTQPTLFDVSLAPSRDGADARQLARRRDPASSKQAAGRAVATGAAGEHEQRILEAVTRQPQATAKEIGELIGLTNVQVLRRTAAMEKRGLIQSSRSIPGWKGELRFALPSHRWSRP